MASGQLYPYALYLRRHAPLIPLTQFPRKAAACPPARWTICIRPFQQSVRGKLCLISLKRVAQPWLCAGSLAGTGLARDTSAVGIRMGKKKNFGGGPPLFFHKPPPPRKKNPTENKLGRRLNVPPPAFNQNDTKSGWNSPLGMVRKRDVECACPPNGPCPTCPDALAVPILFRSPKRSNFSKL